jgi:hypothetical protein
MYTSPPIIRGPQVRKATFEIYPVKISALDEGDPLDGIGITIKDETDTIVAHTSIPLSVEKDVTLFAFVEWLTSYGFSITLDIALLGPIEAVSALIRSLNAGDVPLADYCIPPKPSDFDREHLPALSPEPFGSHAAPTC